MIRQLQFKTTQRGYVDACNGETERGLYANSQNNQ